MQRTSVAIFLLIAALVLVFGYFGVDKLMHPEVWIGWIPSWMDGILTLSRTAWLRIIGLVEILLAILLLIPYDPLRKIVTVLMALQLVGIISQVGMNDVAARDAGLLLSALALAFLL